MSAIRTAVIGAGHLGRIHCRLLRELQDVDLVGVVDPVPEARMKAAEANNTAPYSDHSHIIDLIDAAIIAAPTTYHRDIGVDLLDAGIHLFVEKPLAVTLAEADELVEAANRNNVILQVGHVEQFNPAWLAVKPHVTAPRYIEATRCGPYTFRSTDIGVVLDLMIHDLDLILSLANSPVTDIRSVGFAMMGEKEDVAHARLEFADGAVVTLNASRCSPTPQRTMQLITPHCTAAVDFGPPSATLIRPGADFSERRRQLETCTPSEREYWKEHLFNELLQLEDVPVAESNAILCEQQDFIECIHEGRQPQVSGHQAQAALAIAEQIIQGMTLHPWGEQPLSTGAQAISIPLPQPSPQASPSPQQQRRAG